MRLAGGRRICLSDVFVSESENTMPKNRHNFSTATALLLSLLVIVSGIAQAALPPLIEAKPLFGDKLVAGRWQPVIVTIRNQDSSDALTGEVKVSLEAANTRGPLGSWITPVTLPRGVGTARTTATVFVPESDQPDLLISLSQGRDGRGEIVTRRTFDKLRFVDPSLTLLAVTTLPDALSYLRGETLDVENTTGVLRRIPNATVAKPKNQSYGQKTAVAATEVRVENLPDAGLLPATAAGYDTIGIIYLGPDIGPAPFSDSQVAALHGWVTGGGLLVIGSSGLRADERFRTWLPVAGKAPLGRGMVAAVTRDLAETGFGRSPAALTFWRELAQEACSEPLAGNLIQGQGLRYYYSQMDFWQSVVRAPGLKAPPSSAIALFLLAYLLLLVPINYLILKRLDRREWTWATVPILVTLFSVGAYVFGYAVKGTQMLQNTVTLCEMGANRGESVVTASVGVFSPRQTKYDLSTTIRDTAFWNPQRSGGNNQGSQEYGPMETATAGETGGDSSVHIRNADISMWAMRVFAARTYQIKMGGGVAASLVLNGDVLSGVVTNQTGRDLNQVSLYFAGNRVDLGSLAPGVPKSVRQSLSKGWTNKPKTQDLGLALSGKTGSLHEFKEPVLSSIDSAMEALSQRDQERGNSAGPHKALLFAWNQDELFPVKIDGQPIPTGTNLNLVVVAIPVRSVPKRR